MAPRWFSKVQFGRNTTNLTDVVEKFQRDFESKLKDITFNSTGPIIEVVESDHETDSPQHENCSLKSAKSASVNRSQHTRRDSEYEPQQPVVEDPNSESESDNETPLEIEGSGVGTLQVEHESSNSTCRVQSPELVHKSQVQETNCSNRGRNSVPGQEPNLRRSTRNRLAPLAYARLQRACYKRQGELAGIEEGFPEKYTYGRPKRSGPTSKPEKKKQEKIPHGVTPIENFSFKTSMKGDYEFQSKAFDDLITGVIKLKPGQSKPPAKTSTNHQYMFLVRRGRILFKMIDPAQRKAKTYYASEDAAWIALASGYKYSIKNNGSQQAVVAYIVTKRDSTT